MRILTRYLFRAHLGPFFFALSALTGLLLINTVARRFEELAGKGLPASVILEVFVLSLPHIVALTLPMAVLVAVLYTFSNLAGENEITAMKAGGVNLVRLVLPLAAVGVVLAAGMVVFNDRVLPETNHRLKTLLVDIGRKSPTLDLKEKVINEIRTGDLRTRYFLQAAQIDPSTNRLRDVIIYDLSEPGRERTIYADSGRMAFNTEQTDLFFSLHDGWINELQHREPETLQRLFFEQQLIRLEGVGTELERTFEGGHRSDREMSIAMLRDNIRRWEQELASLGSDAKREVENAVRLALAGREDWAAPRVDMQVPAVRSAAGIRDEPTRRAAMELRSLETRAQMLQNRINQYGVEIHKKFAIPFACIVFVLIGAPLAVRFPRGGAGMVIAISLTIFSIYYVALIGGESLGDRGYVRPFWAMWTSNVIFFGLAIWALTRLGREDSSARSGGWAEVWAGLRERLPLLRRRATLLSPVGSGGD